MIRRCAPLIAVVGAAALTACSSSGGGKPSDTPTPNSRSSSSSAPIHQDPSVPTAVPNDVALRKGACDHACTSVPGGWQAKGTVVNRTAKSITYAITIFFTTPGATVEGHAGAKVRAGAGKSAAWSVRGTFPADKNTTCVLRGVGAAK